MATPTNAANAMQLPLADIHQPAAVGWWPMAPGWWFVIALALLTLTALTVVGYRRIWQPWRLQRSRQQQADALILELEQQWQQLKLTNVSERQHYIIQLQTRLKIWLTWLCPGRYNLASQTDSQWLASLENQAAGIFSDSSKSLLKDGQYRLPANIKESDLEQLHQQACQWIARSTRTSQQPESQSGTALSNTGREAD